MVEVMASLIPNVGTPNINTAGATSALLSAYATQTAAGNRVGDLARSALDRMTREQDRQDKLKQQSILNTRANEALSIQKDRERRASANALDENQAMAAILSNSGPVPTTKAGLVTEQQTKKYNDLLASNKQQAAVFQGIRDNVLKKDTDGDGVISKEEGGVYTTAFNNQLRNANSKITQFSTIPDKPVGEDVPLTKEEYKSAILDQIGYSPTTAAGGKAILDHVNKQVEKQFEKGSNGITPYQQYKISKDIQKTNSIALENKALMTNNERLFKGKNIPRDPVAANKEMHRILDKKYTSKGSITNGISKLVTDEDSDSQANIADNSKELNNILKTKFSGNKEDMLQVIDGFYKRQSSGFFKNWGSGSPMGDALDNFIKKYK